jgi:hypothetical protein
MPARTLCNPCKGNTAVVHHFCQQVVVVVVVVTVILVVNQIHFRHKVYLDMIGKVIPSSR